MLAPALHAVAFVAPAAAVEAPSAQAVQPGTGRVALPAGDQVPLAQIPHVALRPNPALQMGTASESGAITRWWMDQ